MKRGKTEDYYKLNTKAVDDLVNAEDTSDVSEEEMKIYRRRSSQGISVVLKMLLIKFWFSGAVCFFFIWGLAMYVPDLLDLLFITGLAMGFVTDILQNNLIRFLEETKGENTKWMMFGKKRFVSLVFNVLYAFCVVYCVYRTYIAINSFTTARGKSLGVEPVLFGLFYMAYDMLFIGIRNGIKAVFKEAEKKVNGGV